MTRIWVTIALSLVLTSCGSDEVRQSSTDVLQRRQIQRENVAREARVREEQAELAQAREQQGQRHEAAQRAAQTEVPVVQPLEPIPIEMEPLEAPRAMPENPDSAFAKRTIYYAYDAYNLAEEYRSLVEAHSRFLLAHKDYKLRIEGNCDDRGSREYNLALGQRRADSVKRALTLTGVPATQIQTVSFGSEKPKTSVHSEEAYAQNRRVDLVYHSDEKNR
jgi:peptidoglycan-associated lipoprotein